jgi:uncharacterized Fe-S center protein
MKSDVFFTNLRCKRGVNLLQKLQKLIIRAGIDKIDFNNKFVAIKIHFGEPGNLAYIRSNYVKVIVDYVKSKGGIPFVTDANTLYVGRRKNAVEHIEAAFENGFNPFQIGCPVIIADGLRGNSDVEVPINLKHVKNAKIAKEIREADIIITMNHFKGHEQAGFGGCIKNIGMGCGSRRGKMEMHNQGKPFANVKTCVSCGQCAKICAWNAISYDESKKAHIDESKCVGCGRCIGVCNFDAIKCKWDESTTVLNEKIAEYTYATLLDKQSFHINFIMNVSPLCDCVGANDAAIIPDQGILASFDPVAIDQASANIVNQAVRNQNTILDDCVKHNHVHNDDLFTYIHPETNWKAQLDHAEEIGLGTKDYRLVKLE